MYKTFFAFVLFLVFFINVIAQNTNDNVSRVQNGEDANFLYRHEQSFGAFIHSADGIGIAYRRGKHVTGLRKHMWEIESCNFRNPKETLYNGGNIFSANGFYYGKLNSVVLLRGGWGIQNVIYRKKEKKNIEVRYVVFGGLTAAFAKPVYLMVSSPTGGFVAQRFNSSIDPNTVSGRAPFFEGISQTQLIPAAYTKLGLSFDYGERYDAVKTLEVGVIMDAYPKALQLVADSRAQNLLFSVYFKMMWGKKWF